jgi:hypothetical protein
MTKTVSKTEGAEAQMMEVGDQAPAAKKTITNWRVLEEAGLIPVFITHEGYLGSHPSDLVCHSKLRIDLENILRHMEKDHGIPTFKIKFRVSDGKKSGIWRALEEAGVECAQFYCPHCRTEVPFSPRQILRHLNPHPGAIKVNLEPQVLCMTLSTQHPDEEEYSGLYEGENTWQ